MKSKAYARKGLAAALAVALCCTMCPATCLAAENQGGGGSSLGSEAAANSDNLNLSNPSRTTSVGEVATDTTELNISPQSQQNEQTLAANEVESAPFKLLSSTSTINVTAPLRLFFDNCEDGFDVNLKDGNNALVNPTAQARFFSNSGPVRLESITATPSTQQGKENPFNTPESLQLEVKPLNTATTNYTPLVVNLNSNQSAKTTKGFIINTNTKFNFELKNAQSLLKSNQHDNGIEAREFGNIVYTFACDAAISMFVEDQRNTNVPKDTWIYSLDEVKQHAIDIASHNDAVTRQGETETAEHMYTQFATYPTLNETSKNARDGERNYACYMYLESPYNNVYDIRVLGLNQDGLATQSDDIKTAGLSFGFAELLTTDNIGTTVVESFDKTPLWTALNAKDNKNTKYAPIYKTLNKNYTANNVVQVIKRNDTVGTNETWIGALNYTYQALGNISYDYLFINSVAEMGGGQLRSVISDVNNGRTNFYYGCIFGVAGPTAPQYMFWNSAVGEPYDRIEWQNNLPYGTGFGEVSRDSSPKFYLPHDKVQLNVNNIRGGAIDYACWLRTWCPNDPRILTAVEGKKGSSYVTGNWNHAYYDPNNNSNLSSFKGQELGVAPCFCL